MVHLELRSFSERPDAENPAYIEFRLGDYQSTSRHHLMRPPRPGLPTVSGRRDCLLARGRRGRNTGKAHGVSAEPLTHCWDAGWITASVIYFFRTSWASSDNPHYPTDSGCQLAQRDRRRRRTRGGACPASAARSRAPRGLSRPPSRCSSPPPADNEIRDASRPEAGFIIGS